MFFYCCASLLDPTLFNFYRFYSGENKIVLKDLTNTEIKNIEFFFNQAKKNINVYCIYEGINEKEVFYLKKLKRSNGVT